MRSLNLVFNRSQWGGGGCFVCGRVILRGCVALLPAFPVDLRCPGCSVVEYPGKVACPSGRRCSTRNAVWCHSHPGFKSQRYRHCRPAPMGPGGFVMPEWRVRVCACWGRAAWCARGRRATWLMVCPWAAARPRAVRAASFARRVVSKPGQALPPPTGPAAWHRNPLVLSAPSIPAALVSLCVAGRVASKPGQASPPPTGTAAHGFHSLAQQVLRYPPCWSCKPPSGAVRSRFEVVSCPKCRPPRRKTLKTGCYGRSGLRFGRIGTCHSASLAREPAIASGNPLCRT